MWKCSRVITAEHSRMPAAEDPGKCEAASQGSRKTAENQVTDEEGTTKRSESVTIRSVVDKGERRTDGLLDWPNLAA